MIVLDSNVWIAYSYKEDTLHKKACGVMKNINTRVLLPEYILIEVSTVLAQRANKKIADLFLDRVLHNDDILILYSSPKFFDAVVKLFQTNGGKQLSFIDTALVYLSRWYSVITFDKALEKAIRKAQ